MVSIAFLVSFNLRCIKLKANGQQLIAIFPHSKKDTYNL